MSRRLLPSIRRSAALAVGLAVALVLSTLSPLASVSPAAAAIPAEITRTLTHQGRTVTVRLAPVPMRGAGFEVLLQQADGTLVPQTVTGERSYFGGVDGDPAATAAGIIRSDGKFEGLVVFDRGATWFFLDNAVTGDRGLTPPSEFKWPAATDATRLSSVAPGQAGAESYRFDMGFDMAHNAFVDPAVGGSVARALDAIEMTAVSFLPLYEGNALLRPLTGRVIFRGDADAQPYRDGESGAQLGSARTEWRTTQADAGVDNVLYFNTYRGGGLAYLATSGTDWSVSHNGEAGWSRAIARHEMAHNWGADDNHTNGPEGPTVVSGNQYHRFDGTELSAILRYRDARQAATAPFTPIGVFDRSIPPYASLDLVDRVVSGQPVTIRPTANDHDANAEALTLVSVGAAHRGGTATRSGEFLTYTAPAVTQQTVDWVEYVVEDSSGKRATGVSLFRVDPAFDPGSPDGWAPSAVSTEVPYSLTNLGSGTPASVPAATAVNTNSLLVVRPADGARSQFRFESNPDGTVRIRNVHSQRCVDVYNASGAENAKVATWTCSSAANQQWRPVVNPAGGVSFRSVSSGKCLATKSGGLSHGTELAQAACAISTTQRWEVVADVPPVEQWAEVGTLTTQQQLIEQLSSGLGAATGNPGLPANDLALGAATSSSNRFTFTRGADGAYEVRNAQRNTCIDVYSGSQSEGAQVGTYSCSTSANQRWRVLENPAGDLAIRSVSSGKCLMSQDRGSAVGTLLVQATCGFDRAQRWRIVLP